MQFSFAGGLKTYRSRVRPVNSLYCTGFQPGPRKKGKNYAFRGRIEYPYERQREMAHRLSLRKKEVHYRIRIVIHVRKFDR